MVQRNGGSFMRSTQRTEMEERVKEKERELKERYRVKVEEKRETVPESSLSSYITNTEMLHTSGGRRDGAGYSSTTGRRGKEGDEMEERVTVKPVVNGLRSTPATPEPSEKPETQNGSTPQVKRSSSFRLTAGKGQWRVETVFIACSSFHSSR